MNKVISNMLGEKTFTKKYERRKNKTLYYPYSPHKSEKVCKDCGALLNEGEKRICDTCKEKRKKNLKEWGKDWMWED